MAEDFKITQDEASRIREAMKKPDFRKLFAEYAQEISDPENKKKYEEELIALEKQRGVDMKYIHPKAGFVMKSFLLPESTSKIFINVCHSDTIGPAISTPAKNKNKKKRGERWSIPYSLTPPRNDVDKSNNKCSVVDAIFNTETFQKGKDDIRFKQMLVDTVFDGLEEQLKLKVDRDKVVYLRMPYKGVAAPAVIRTKVEAKQETPDFGGLKVPFPPLKEERETKSNEKRKKEDKDKPPTEPKYTILHRGEFTMQDFTNDRESTLIKRPKELVVSVELPGVESAAAVDLDIFEKKMALKSETPFYKLDLALPYPIDEEKGNAKFDKSEKVLTVTLPVLPPLLKAQVCPQRPPLITPLQTDADQLELHENIASSSCPEEDSVEDTLSQTGEEWTIVEENESRTLGPNALGPNDDFEQNQPSDSHPASSELLPPLAVTGRTTEIQGNWSSKGEWVCPPFSYRQEDATIAFCLHTANVKEKSLVNCFDDHYVQLTYSTHRDEKYSFYISFPECCSLDVDVDVSEDNVVILLKKETAADKLAHQWQKFFVGLNASQTTEKLFLTTSNVDSVIQQVDDLPDPWKSRRIWSDSATATVAMVAEKDRLDIEIKDPDRENGVAQPHTSRGAERTGTKGNGKHSNGEALSNGPPSTVVLPGNGLAPDKPETTLKGSISGGVVKDTIGSSVGDKVSSTTEGITSTDSLTAAMKGVSLESTDEPVVRVEEDGSVFIRGDSDYMRDREAVLSALGTGGEKNTTDLSNKVKFSNKLLYSLD